MEDDIRRKRDELTRRHENFETFLETLSMDKMRPEMRDTIKRIPKRRGFGKNRARTVNASVQKPVSVNLDTLERLFEQGTTITPQSLHKRGALTISKNRMPPVKILGRGVVTKKFIVKNCLVSLSAKEAIEKAGGKVS